MENYYLVVTATKISWRQ